MKGVILLCLVLFLVSLNSFADQPSSDIDADQAFEHSGSALMESEFVAPALMGLSVEDYRRCNMDCKSIWSENLSTERLECVKGCRSVRSLNIIALPELPE